MLFDVFQQYPAAMPILATVGGLIIGSFLNVVIWRYPIMLRQQMAEFHGEMSSAQSKISLALPRSHCPHCQQTIRVRDNIPLLSWLMLKGRCRDCQAKISKRYPLVELLTALAFLLASLVWPESGWALAVMILSAWLIAASIIDLDHQWLPDVFTQGVLWTGLIAAPALPSRRTGCPFLVGLWLAMHNGLSAASMNAGDGAPGGRWLRSCSAPSSMSRIYRFR